MTTDFYSLLISDSALALVLLGLFWYVSRISRGIRGIATWGAAHLAYTVGASLLDGTAQELVLSGNSHSVAWVAGIGGMLACAGLVGLAWSIILFVQQRSLSWLELALMPLCLGFSLVGWMTWNTIDAQGAAMSATEVLVLSVMIWHLRQLRLPPARLPAQLMMLGSAVLFVLYARDLIQALTGTYGPNEAWVNVDLSTWYLLNFCMLMLTSFRAAESLRQSALLDPLTGALNRRGLNNELHELHAKPSDGKGLALIAIDLDHFKSVNDTHGHPFGDIVLQRFSDTVRHCIRAGDLFVRNGGEEFLIIAPDADPEAALAMAERIRTQVMQLDFSPTAPKLQITTSLGIAHSSASTATFPILLRLADEALYKAKRKGRNRTETNLFDGAEAKPAH